MKRDGLKYLTLREKQALVEYLERLRSEFKDEVQHVILYGSKVRGDFDEESDIDLFVVLKLSFRLKLWTKAKFRA